MRQLTIALLLLVAVAVQSALRSVWQPLGYVDLTLILVVYFALQREPLQALIVAAVAARPPAFLAGVPPFRGAGGFSKNLLASRLFCPAPARFWEPPLLGL